MNYDIIIKESNKWLLYVTPPDAFQRKLFFLIKTGKHRAEVDGQRIEIPEYTGQKNNDLQKPYTENEACLASYFYVRFRDVLSKNGV